MIKVCFVPAQALRAGLGWGQQQFALLLQESPASDAAADAQSEDVCLEELRYRWMLHKSKLKDVGDLRSRKSAMVGYGVILALTTWWRCCTTLLVVLDDRLSFMSYCNCYISYPCRDSKQQKGRILLLQQRFQR